MPPKKSDLIHVTFHFHKSAVLLSLPGSTNLSALKSELLPALQPFSAVLPSIPTKESDVQLWEDKEIVEGGEHEAGQLTPLEDQPQNKSLVVLQWPRWKKVFVSFKQPDGTFGQPVYTVPSVDDGEAEEET